MPFHINRIFHIYWTGPPSPKHSNNSHYIFRFFPHWIFESAVFFDVIALSVLPSTHPTFTVSFGLFRILVFANMLLLKVYWFFRVLLKVKPSLILKHFRGFWWIVLVCWSCSSWCPKNNRYLLFPWFLWHYWDAWWRIQNIWCWCSTRTRQCSYRWVEVHLIFMLSCREPAYMKIKYFLFGELFDQALFIHFDYIFV